MKKPDNYENTEARTGGGTGPSAGPYVCQIVTAVETLSSSNRSMMVLELDIAQGPFKGYYQQQQNRRTDGKSSFQIHRRCTDGDQVAYFKGDILAIEKSNPGFKFNFNEETLVGRLVGATFRDEEYLNNAGVVKSFPKVAWLFPIDEIGKQVVPKPKLLSADKRPAIERATNAADLFPIPSDNKNSAPAQEIMPWDEGRE